MLPKAFKWDFLNTVEAEVIILTWYVKPNETMAINKFQRSRQNQKANDYGTWNVVLGMWGLQSLFK